MGCPFQLLLILRCDIHDEGMRGTKTHFLGKNCYMTCLLGMFDDEFCYDSAKTLTISVEMLIQGDWKRL